MSYVPHELWYTLVSQTILPDDTPSQALLSRKPTREEQHPTCSEMRVLSVQLLLPTHTLQRARSLCSRAAIPEGQRNPVWQHTKSRQCLSWQQFSSELQGMCTKRVRWHLMGLLRFSFYQLLEYQDLYLPSAQMGAPRTIVLLQIQTLNCRSPKRPIWTLLQIPFSQACSTGAKLPQNPHTSFQFKLLQ